MIVPASLQHIDKTFQIGIDIGMGMVDRMAHAGLRGEDEPPAAKRCLREQCPPSPSDRQVDLHKTEARIGAAKYSVAPASAPDRNRR